MPWKSSNLFTLSLCLHFFIHSSNLSSIFSTLLKLLSLRYQWSPNRQILWSSLNHHYNWHFHIIEHCCLLFPYLTLVTQSLSRLSSIPLLLFSVLFLGYSSCFHHLNDRHFSWPFSHLTNSLVIQLIWLSNLYLLSQLVSLTPNPYSQLYFGHLHQEIQLTLILIPKLLLLSYCFCHYNNILICLFISNLFLASILFIISRTFS